MGVLLVVRRCGCEAKIKEIPRRRAASFDQPNGAGAAFADDHRKGVFRPSVLIGPSAVQLARLKRKSSGWRGSSPHRTSSASCQFSKPTPIGPTAPDRTPF